MEMETQTLAENTGIWPMGLGILLELVLNCGHTGVLIWVCTLHYYMFQWWVIKIQPIFAIVSILCGIYLIISFTGNVFIFYAAVSNSSLKRRKTICRRWLIFRITSFIIPIAFLFNFLERTMVYICSSTMLIWFFTLVTVANFMSYINETIQREANESSGDHRNPYKRPLPGVARRNSPRPSSRAKVAPVIELPAGQGKQPVPVVLTLEHIQQLEQFQDYIRRTSWCSWSDAGRSLPPSGRRSRNMSAFQSRF